MPKVPAPPIAQRELAGRLLADGVARRLPTEIEWRNGVNFNSECGVDGGTWSCETYIDEGREKDRAPVGDVVEFDSFLVYHERQCDALTPREVAEGLAESGLRRLRSQFFAKELHGGGSETGNPTLQSAGVTVSTGTLASLSNTLMGLLDLYEERGTSDLLLHAPLWTLPEWKKQSLVEFTGSRYQMGGIPIAFDAYPNIGPDDTGNDAPAKGDGEAWIYVSGPVEWAADNANVETSLEQRENITIAIAESLGLLRFDPCSVYAAKARVC